MLRPDQNLYAPGTLSESYWAHTSRENLNHAIRKDRAIQGPIPTSQKGAYYSVGLSTTPSDGIACSGLVKIRFSGRFHMADAYTALYVIFASRRADLL